MSSTSVPPNIQEMMDGLYFNYTDFAALVLIVYDTILTFPYEIEFLWKRKWRLAAVLYFLTRYAWILEQIVQLVFDFRSNTSIKACTSMTHMLDILGVLTTASGNGLVLARTYAISSKSKVAFTLFASLFIGMEIPDVIVAAMDSCTTNSQFQAETIIGGVFDIISVIIALSVTTYRTRSVLMMRSDLKGTGTTSVIYVFVQQEVLHFLVILSWHILSQVLNRVLRPTLVGIDQALGSSVFIILVCRFMLKIRQAYAHPNGTSLARRQKPLSITSVCASVRNSVVEEFGGSLCAGVPGLMISSHESPVEFAEADNSDEEDITTNKFSSAGQVDLERGQYVH